MMTELKYPAGATPFLLRDSRCLNLAERIIKQCEKGLTLYAEGDKTKLAVAGLNYRTEEKFLSLSYLMRRANNLIRESFGTPKQRKAEITRAYYFLISNGFIEPIEKGERGQIRFYLTGLHTTSAASRLKEYM
ncbi:hypothetical protein IAK14_004221 [Salmonella enterica]|nr:hypothetical protein [Salmonella enterica]